MLNQQQGDESRSECSSRRETVLLLVNDVGVAHQGRMKWLILAYESRTFKGVNVLKLICQNRPLIFSKKVEFDSPIWKIDSQ